MAGDDDADWDKIWPPSKDEMEPFFPDFWDQHDKILRIDWAWFQRERWVFLIHDDTNELFYNLFVEGCGALKKRYIQVQKNLKQSQRKREELDIRKLRLMLIVVTNRVIDSRNPGRCKAKNYRRILGEMGGFKEDQ